MDIISGGVLNKVLKVPYKTSDGEKPRGNIMGSLKMDTLMKQIMSFQNNFRYNSK